MTYNEMHPDFSALEGKTVTSISGMEDGSGCIRFNCSDGTEYQMYHSQDCCESVYLQDVCGDVSDLLNTPIIEAREDSNIDEPDKLNQYDECFKWTFYRMSTIKGTVVLRWYGTSNGYYSMSVDFCRIK